MKRTFLLPIFASPLLWIHTIYVNAAMQAPSPTTISAGSTQSPPAANSPNTQPPIRSAQDILNEKLNLRDPFKAPSIITNDMPPKSELESFEIDKFRLIGVITGPDKVRAIIQSPTGRNHIVTEKMAIGSRGGKIAKITPEWIQVREKQINIVGHEQSVMSYIHLPSEHSIRTNTSEKLIDQTIHDTSNPAINSMPGNQIGPPSVSGQESFQQLGQQSWQNTMTQGQMQNQNPQQPTSQNSFPDPNQFSPTNQDNPQNPIPDPNQPDPQSLGQSINNQTGNTQPNSSTGASPGLQWLSSPTTATQQDSGTINPPQGLTQ